MAESGTIPAQDLRGFSRKRVERIIVLVVGFGCLGLGLQAAFAAAGASDAGDWGVVLKLIVFVPLAIMIVACAAHRFVDITCTVFVVAYTVVLVAWPFVTAGSTPRADVQPWIWYLLNVATVAAVVAFQLRLQIAVAAALPLLFGVARVAQGGFSADFIRVNALDVSFALLLGAVLIILGWMLRAMAERVDAAREVAISSHAQAASVAAAEEERRAIAALMHDSVLAALIAAERATSPREQELAAGMARDALTRLANAETLEEEGASTPTPLSRIAGDLRAAAAGLGVAPQIDEPASGTVPEHVARAMVLAATQAIANAVEHAHGLGLAVTVAPYGNRGCSVTVRDDGPGIDLEAIGEDRLGIRGSIFARLAAIGGGAGVGRDGDATVVLLQWEER